MAYSPAIAPLDDLVSFEDWQKTLEELFSDLLDIPAAQVSFLRQPRQHRRGARVQLDPIAFLHFGVDERRQTQSQNTFELVEEAIGQRVMVLQVSVWTDGQSLQRSPIALIERLRTRMRLQSTTDVLIRCGLGFDRAEQPVTFPETRDGRVLSRSSIDLRLSYAWVESDAENASSWIEQAEIRADKLRDPTGTAYPDAIQPTILVDTSSP